MSATAEVLRKALELLGPNGEHWCKERYFNGNKMCMQGATRRASLYADDSGFTSALCTNALLKAVPDCEGNPIARWNDAPERTWPEVKAAFEKAIGLAEADSTNSPVEVANG